MIIIIIIRLPYFLAGKAFSVVEVNGEKYVKANGTLSQHIATYRFKVEKSDSYTVWIEILGTSKADNSVFYYIDEHMQQTVHPTFIIGKPAWTWNCFNQVCLFFNFYLNSNKAKANRCFSWLFIYIHM